MALLGLLLHLAEREHAWFRIIMAGQDVPRRYRSEAEPSAESDGAVADPAVVSEAWQAWRAKVAFAEEFVAQVADLAVTRAVGDGRTVDGARCLCT